MKYPAYMQALQTPQLQDFATDLSPLMQAWQMGAQMREMNRAKSAAPSVERDPRTEKLDGTLGELNHITTTLSQIQATKDKIYRDNGGNADLIASDPRNRMVQQLEQQAYAQAPMMKRRQDLQNKYAEHTKNAGGLFNQQAILGGKMDKYGAYYGDTASKFERANSWEESTNGYNLEHSTAGQDVLEKFFENIDKSDVGHTKRESGHITKTVVDSIRVDGGSAKAMVTQGGGGGMNSDNLGNLKQLRSSLGITTDVQHAFFQSYMAEVGKSQMSKRAGKVNSEGSGIYKEYEGDKAFENIKDAKGRVVGRRLKADAAMFDKDGKPTDAFYADMGSYIKNKIDDRVFKRRDLESRSGDSTYSVGRILTADELNTSPTYGFNNAGLVNSLLNGGYTTTAHGVVAPGSLDKYVGQMANGSVNLEAWKAFANQDPYLQQKKDEFAKQGKDIYSPAFFKEWVTSKSGSDKSHEQRWNEFIETGKVDAWGDYVNNSQSDEAKWIRGEIAAGRLDSKKAYSEAYRDEFVAYDQRHAESYYSTLKGFDLPKIVATNNSYAEDFNATLYPSMTNGYIHKMLGEAEKKSGMQDGKGFVPAPVYVGGRFTLMGKEFDGSLLNGVKFKRDGNYGAVPSHGVDFQTKDVQFKDPSTGNIITKRIIDLDKPVLPRTGTNQLATAAEQKAKEDTWLYYQSMLQDPATKELAKANMEKVSKVMPLQTFAGGEVMIPVKSLGAFMSQNQFNKPKDLNTTISRISDKDAREWATKNNPSIDDYKSVGFKEFLNPPAPGYVAIKNTPSVADIKKLMVKKGAVSASGPNQVLSEFENANMSGGVQLPYTTGDGKNQQTMMINTGMNQEAIDLLNLHNNGAVIVEDGGELYLKTNTKMTSSDLYMHTSTALDAVINQQVNGKKKKQPANKFTIIK